MFQQLTASVDKDELVENIQRTQPFRSPLRCNGGDEANSNKSFSMYTGDVAQEVQLLRQTRATSANFMVNEVVPSTYTVKDVSPGVRPRKVPTRNSLSLDPKLNKTPSPTLNFKPIDTTLPRQNHLLTYGRKTSNKRPKMSQPDDYLMVKLDNMAPNTDSHQLAGNYQSSNGSCFLIIIFAII